MSLDVYLTDPKGTEKECLHCGSTYTENEELFSANITHNLANMAREAGVYEYLWRPDEVGVERARELIKPLKVALKDMKKRPEHYKQFNAENGWGLYRNFVPWIERYLDACIEYPDSFVGAYR